MFAKVKSTVFIDKLRLYLSAKADSSLTAVLKDDKGSVCSSLETVMPQEQHEMEWTGLNNLPYGVYTLELSDGTEEMQMRLVKRV
jgi:hypothetical protein